MSEAIIQQPNKTQPSRRDFLKLSWGAAGALALAEIGVMTLRFLSPGSAEGEFGGMFTVGNVEAFPAGSVTPFPNGRFYLVRLEDGGLLALYHKCTHLGCAVPWNHAAGTFICPCHASAFEPDGAVVNPPAPRPLDRFLLSVENGVIMVDTSARVQRDRVSVDDAVYA